MPGRGNRKGKALAAQVNVGGVMFMGHVSKIMAQNSFGALAEEEIEGGVSGRLAEVN